MIALQTYVLQHIYYYYIIFLKVQGIKNLLFVSLVVFSHCQYLKPSSCMCNELLPHVSFSVKPNLIMKMLEIMLILMATVLRMELMGRAPLPTIKG